MCFIILFFTLFFIASLPQQLQGELDLASRTGAPDAPERSGIDRGVRVREVHLVEKVEKLRPELKPHPLRECEVFDGREIRVDGCWTDQDITSRIPIDSARKLL